MTKPKTYSEMKAVSIAVNPGGLVYVLENGDKFALPMNGVLQMLNLWRQYWHRAKEYGIKQEDTWLDWLFREE